MQCASRLTTGTAPQAGLSMLSINAIVVVPYIDKSQQTSYYAQHKDESESYYWL